MRSPMCFTRAGSLCACPVTESAPRFAIDVGEATSQTQAQAKSGTRSEFARDGRQDRKPGAQRARTATGSKTCPRAVRILKGKGTTAKSERSRGRCG